MSSYYYICVLPTPTVNPTTRSSAAECVVCVYVSVGVGVGVHFYMSTCMFVVCVFVAAMSACFMSHVYWCGCVGACADILYHTHTHTHTISPYCMCPHTAICVLILLYESLYYYILRVGAGIGPRMVVTRLRVIWLGEITRFRACVLQNFNTDLQREIERERGRDAA